MRMVVFAPAEVEIEDTWTVSGLCGTGSHHFTADEVLVPAERTFATMESPPCLDIPLLRFPMPPALIAPAIASAALGVAQGALADVVDLASGKVPLLAAAPLATNPLFQYQLATADTEPCAARGLVHGMRNGLGDGRGEVRIRPRTARPDPRHGGLGEGHEPSRGSTSRITPAGAGSTRRRPARCNEAARRPCDH